MAKSLDGTCFIFHECIIARKEDKEKEKIVKTFRCFTICKNYSTIGDLSDSFCLRFFSEVRYLAI